MKLFCFGFGYSASFLARRLAEAGGWQVMGTRTAPPANARGLVAWGGNGRTRAVVDALADTTHVLVSVPPGPDGCPVLADFAADLAAAPKLRWIGYLSTIGVYGDHGGAWIDETTPVAPASERTKARVSAEKAWWSLATGEGVVGQVVRLPGIYGPGRSTLDQLRAGTARRIVKPGQVFNRIHVEDIAGAVHRAMMLPDAMPVINVVDDEPSPPQDVVAFGAQLLGLPIPPETPFEAANLSAMGRSFYEECKRVRNVMLRRDLGYQLRYPTYREGLAAILADERRAAALA
jgi:nucleoside-diphosphate-sugar epimerase